MDVCEICGYEKGLKSFTVLGKSFSVKFYKCGCLDKKRAEEEIEFRKKKAKQMESYRLQESGLPKLCIENSFSIPSKSILKIDEDTKEPIDIRDYEKIHRFMSNLSANIKKGISLFIPGNPGTGKTIILGELGKYAITLGFDVRYFTASKIINEKIDLARFRFTDLVIIDDLGMNKVEIRENKLFEFVNDRIDNRKSTFIATNSTEQQNKEFFGEAFVDRIKLFYTCFMVGPSRREFKHESLF